VTSGIFGVSTKAQGTKVMVVVKVMLYDGGDRNGDREVGDNRW
jgi:hypothetical protein